MEYYERKTKAMDLIDNLAERGEFLVESICFEVLRKTAMSELFTRKYINKLIESGHFGIDEDGILKPLEG